MIEFLSANVGNILFVLSVLVLIAILYRFNKKDLIKKIILSFVVKAEKSLGSGTGDLKYAIVIDSVYSKLPLLVRLTFSKKEIDNFIEEAVKKMKDVLKDGKTLTGYDDEIYLGLVDDK